MKLKNILRNVTAMALPLALLGSCTGDFEELNTNPYEICLLYTSPSPRDCS